jgi:hypothetical protein
MKTAIRTKPACERCGQPALVNITNDEAHGITMRHFCLACAEAEEMEAEQRDQYLNYGAILISVGLFVLVLSVFADWLAFGHPLSGFAWKQRTGVALAGMLILTAAVVQIPTMLVIGVLFGTLTILADLLAFGQAPGFGWQQTLGTVLGLLLLLTGISEARRRP